MYLFLYADGLVGRVTDQNYGSKTRRWIIPNLLTCTNWNYLSGLRSRLLVPRNEIGCDYGHSLHWCCRNLFSVQLSDNFQRLFSSLWSWSIFSFFQSNSGNLHHEPTSDLSHWCLYWHDNGVAWACHCCRQLIALPCKSVCIVAITRALMIVMCEVCRHLLHTGSDTPLLPPTPTRHDRQTLLPLSRRIACRHLG